MMWSRQRHVADGCNNTQPYLNIFLQKRKKNNQVNSERRMQHDIKTCRRLQQYNKM